MKRFLHLFFALVCCLSASFSFAAVVENVRSFRDADRTRLVLDLSTTAEHRLFTLQNPSRIVVDIDDSSMKGNFESINLADTPISKIRTAARNQNDLRIVFDLKGAVQPKSFLLAKDQQNGERLVIDFYQNGSQSSNNPTTKPVISASAMEVSNGQRDIVVAISAGHGGHDPGAVGVNRLQEKKVTLAIAKKLEQILAATPGYKPVMVRESDYYVNLRRRIGIAHEHSADLYIAIHADSAASSKAKGITVYALSQRGATTEQARRLAKKENSADLIGGVGSVSLNDKDEVLASVLLDLSITATVASSLEVGNNIISSLSDVAHIRRSNVEQAAFVELKSADIPSLLIETGYITNATDAKNLNSSSHQRKLANAIADGISSYFYTTPPRGSWVSWNKENGSSASQEYTVRRGDSLSAIAQRFQVSLNALKNANNLRKSTINIGQKLNIPGRATPTIAQVSFSEHIITSGETLSKIANDYSISLQRIRETNQLNSDTIRIGQVLRIPSS